MKVVVINIRYYPGIFLEGLRETMTVRAVSVPINMQTGPLLNTSQQYCYLCHPSSILLKPANNKVENKFISN
jgi:hypothetical protein